ncbi:hypothetical protein M7I_0173 [Glarea lozoyensis 74030]|uniref:Fibronectin type-III domain-containing protein n=1 Tax=Glarea lozoyensis (strain ATCC 74030 / MF5533) TaxID=1104152 RepID=H0ECM9_GLAL7|nr:hypothetical protein M7I_0173 [Glarea lozoyensis 74030]
MNAQTFWLETWQLLHRAWLTLWKPVPELISILGVEVPDTPEVSLAGITKGSITVHLERPNANKPVLKYLIQVNGVNVGELPQRETVVIEVTGLKPGHFYNVRVIALGSNNFQAGSRVIRARTYGRDGHPQLENGAVPSNAVDDEHQSDSGEEEPTLRTHGAAIELVVAEGSQPMVRESSLTHPGQRRNTGGRKHSPSNPITDHSALANIASNYTHESLSQLEEKFEGLQKEMAEIGAQIVKDAEEFKVHSRNLVKERDDNRKVLKEKEEASEKLKREVNHSERANRQTQTRKQQKEKVLREKQNERAKMHTDLERWRNEIEQMKAEREEWQRDKQDLLNDKEKKAEELRDVIRKRQNSLHGLDQEVNLKGKLLLELEEERKKLQGDHEDDESRERDAATKQRDDEWTARELDLRQQLNAQAMHIRQLEDSAPFGWPAAEGSIINRNSPLATNWSHNATTTTTWSRNPSRRPSIQHGSTSLFTSGVASDDDEFLPSDSMLGQTSPAAVGVIGTRPASSQKQVTPRLNPAAPTFKAMFSFSSSKDKDKDRSKGKERSIDSTAFDVAIPPVSSPSESRKSRDTHSVHTQNSVAESTESLDRISSNTPSDANPSGATSKDKESSIARLLRKGSSSKFSLSSRRGEKAGLFGSKKGVNSAANSDRDGSMDLGDDTPFGKSFDSVTSSPMLGGMASGEWNKKDAHPTTPKEGRMSVAWGRLGIKKGKGRESLDVDRSEAETTDTDDKDN